MRFLLLFSLLLGCLSLSAIETKKRFSTYMDLGEDKQYLGLDWAKNITCELTSEWTMHSRSWIPCSSNRKISGRGQSMKILFKDEIKEGKGTEYIIDSLELDIQIPKHIFSRASLRK